MTNQSVEHLLSVPAVKKYPFDTSLQEKKRAQELQLCKQKKTASTRIAVAHLEKHAGGTGEQESLANSARSKGSPNCCLFFLYRHI